MTEIIYRTQQVKVLFRQRLAARRNRVLRGVGVTRAAKRTQGACRLCDGASKVVDSGADVVVRAEGSIRGTRSGWSPRIRRGLRAGHVGKGPSGTWEISFSPPKRVAVWAPR